MKKLILLLSSLALMSCVEKNTSDVASFEAMNTFMTVKSYGRNAKKADSEVERRIREIEGKISTTDESSDVYKINNSGENVVEVSDETAFLAEFSLNAAEETGGALNPCLYPVTRVWGFTTGEYRVPEDSEIEKLLESTDFRKISVIRKPKAEIKKEIGMMLDFGSVGKGFACDEAVKILKKRGVESSLVDFGGNVYVLGGKIGQDGEKNDWTVGIQNPSGGEPVAKLLLQDKAVVTSGGYERFFTDKDGKRRIHIFDPQTGKPVENTLESVTVVADSALYADALSTSLFVMGFEKAIDFWRGKRDFEMVLVTEDFGIYYTEGLKGKFSATTKPKSLGIIR